jgi:hypothetical protein
MPGICPARCVGSATDWIVSHTCRGTGSIPSRVAWFTTPSVLVRFQEPVIAAGLWGRKKTAAAIGVPVDEVDAFLRAVEIA